MNNEWELRVHIYKYSFLTDGYSDSLLTDVVVSQLKKWYKQRDL